MRELMNTRHQGKQGGATLIVSLVLLAIITILGLASIRSSNLELKMAASARDRAIAFQRAESALTRIEEQLKSDQPSYTVADVLSTCTSNRCFNANCDFGLCFAGDYADAVSTTQCKLNQFGTNFVEFWEDETLWNNTDRHMVASVGGTSDDVEVADVQYIVEFLCFVPRSEQIIVGANQAGETDVPLYRVTVRAEGEAERSTVMLQSTVRAAR